MLERVCRKGTLLPCWWECKLEHHNRKHLWRFLKKLKIELLYDLAIPFPGIYPEKAIIRKDTCTSMFVIALFTIAKTWKQPKCALTDEWIKKTWYIHTMEYYSTIGKQWNKAISSNMDGPRDYHIKWSKSKTNIVWYHLYVESFQKRYKWIYLQNRNRLTGFENKFMVTKEKT